MEVSEDPDESIDSSEQRSFETKLNNVLSKYKINPATKQLISATFYSWDSMVCCPKKTPTPAKEELGCLFEEFILKRESLQNTLSQNDIELSKLDESSFIYYWFQGEESLTTFLSDEANEWFDEREIDTIRSKIADLKNDISALSESCNPNQTTPHLLDQSTEKKENENASSPSDTKKLGSALNCEVKVVPLLLCSEQTQDGSKVYKFEVNQAGYQCLVEMGCPDSTIPSSSCKSDEIDLQQLNATSLTFVGLIGPFDAVMKSFNEEVVVKIKSSAILDQSGLYLIRIENENNVFVIYYSQNDEDFEAVRKDSKLVHFLRYLSELTHQVIFCLSETGENLFTNNSDISKPKRMQLFACQDKLQEPEDCQATELGATPIMLSDCDDVYASDTAFCLISKQMLPTNKIERRNEKTTKDQLIKTLQFFDFDESFQLSKPIKYELVRHFFPQAWKSIQNNVSNDLQKLNPPPPESSEEVLADAIAFHFIQKHFPLEYSILENFFPKKESGKSLAWEIHKTDKKYLEAIDRDDIPRLENAFEDAPDDNKYFIRKQLLKIYLDKEKPKSWGETFSFLTKEKPWKWATLKAEALKLCGTDDAVSLAITKEADFALKPEFSDWVKLQLPNFIEYFSCQVKSICAQRKIFENYAEQIDERYSVYKFKKSRLVVQANFWFDKKRRPPKSNDKITEIRKIESENWQYEVHYAKAICIRPQQEIRISFPVFEKRKSKTAEPDEVNIGHFNFKSFESFRLQEYFLLSQAYPVDETAVVILMNKSINEDSRAALEHSAKIQVLPSSNVSIPIRHPITSSSFDSKTRLLAIFCQEKPTTILLIKFEQGYRNTQGSKQIEFGELIGALEIFQFCFQHKSPWLWVSVRKREGSFFCKYNYATMKLLPIENLNGISSKLACTPNGHSVLNFSEYCDVKVVMTGTGNVLPKTLSFCGNLKYIKLTQVKNQILMLQKHENRIFATKLEISGALYPNLADEVDNKTHQLDEWHWIRSISLMYNKFPCNDLLASEQPVNQFWIALPSNASPTYTKNISNELKSVRSELKKNNKPTDYMKIDPGFANVSDTFLSSFLGTNQLTNQSIGSFLIKLITFIPVQIARTQANQLVLMNGMEPMNLESVKSTIELAASISFELYNAVFRMWTGNVKVISSMGKQSTGKSFTLNHLTGSSFNISGARCTDGCWMSVKTTEDCMYVILDFEGLGSFERSDQEDMILSLLNSAISSITLFKCEKRFERDMERLLHNMTLGCNQFKGAESLFRGFFVMVINDVAESDINETVHEFRQKIAMVINKSEKNFISQLFRSGYGILSFPLFATEAYYEQMHELLEMVNKSAPSLFKDGDMFASTLKLVLAKLAIGDFTPLGRQQFDERIGFLESKIQCAVDYGQLSSKTPKTPDDRLKKIGDRRFEIKTTKTVDVFLRSIIIDDLCLTFSEDVLAFFLTRFKSEFPISHKNNKLWRTSLQDFVSECIKFRFERVESWLIENLSPWKDSEDSSVVESIKKKMADWQTNWLIYQKQYSFCEEKCKQCFLKCTKIVDHSYDIKHNCSTDHKCKELCAHCQKQLTNVCGLQFGHEGEHICTQIKHVCNDPCKYNNQNGCEGKCQKEITHTGFHQCSQKSHKCKKKCSLETCSGSCIAEVDTPHSVHKCSREKCDSKCCVGECPNSCENEDHFHGTGMDAQFRAEQELPVKDYSVFTGHFCGNEHPCKFDCQKEGHCHKVAERAEKEEEQTYEGAISSFKYSLKFKEVGKKMLCWIKIPPYEKNHEGVHICSSNSHSCTVQCPTCDNFCDKPVGHEKKAGDVLHDTSHGNMVKRFFHANEDEIQIGAHKYTVGESSIAEMCHIFCNELGRGHIHVVQCQNDETNATCREVKGEKRHQTTKYKPDVLKEKDEMTHKAYWASINFKDPSSNSAKESFGKCPVYCNSEDHDESEKSYCILDVFHDPWTSGTSTGSMKKGHVFGCSHDEKKYHFSLYLSNSDSFKGKGGESLKRFVTDFVNRRKELENGDQFSIALFCKHGSYVIANHVEVSQFNETFLQQFDEQKKRGIELTNAMDIINQEFDPNHINRSILVSDWLSNEHIQRMKEIYCEKEGCDISKITTLDEEKDYRVASARHPPSVGISV